MTTEFVMMTFPEFLEHAGVKGMKWGVRKDKESTSNSKPKKAPLTDEEAARRKKIVAGTLVTAGVLAAIAGTAYAAYEIKTVSNISKLAKNGVEVLNRPDQIGPDRILKVGSEFTRRSYMSNGAWGTKLRTYVAEGKDFEDFKAYGDKIFKFNATKDVRIAGLDTQKQVLGRSPYSSILRKSFIEENAKYSLSGRLFVTKVMSDEKFATSAIESLRSNVWNGPDSSGSKLATMYVNVLKNMGYSGVNDVNLPGSPARVLFDPAAFVNT